VQISEKVIAFSKNTLASQYYSGLQGYFFVEKKCNLPKIQVKQRYPSQKLFSKRESDGIEMNEMVPALTLNKGMIVYLWIIGCLYLNQRKSLP